MNGSVRAPATFIGLLQDHSEPEKLPKLSPIHVKAVFTAPDDTDAGNIILLILKGHLFVCFLKPSARK